MWPEIHLGPHPQLHSRRRFGTTRSLTPSSAHALLERPLMDEPRFAFGHLKRDPFTTFGKTRDYYRP